MSKVKLGEVQAGMRNMRITGGLKEIGGRKEIDTRFGTAGTCYGCPRG